VLEPRARRLPTFSSPPLNLTPLSETSARHGLPTKAPVHATHPLCVIRPPTPATASSSSHSSAASSHRSANFSPHCAQLASLQPDGKRSTGAAPPAAPPPPPPAAPPPAAPSAAAAAPGGACSASKTEGAESSASVWT